jgi:hypothetical protein
MQRLDLDFRKIRPAAPWARWALLALAVAFTADLGVSYWNVREAIAQKEGRLAEHTQSENGGASARSRSISPEEIALARETIQRISTPWGNLFSALESTPSDGIALLAIEPDAKSGTVVISGEGKDYPAALDYASDLGRAKTLNQVHLIKHEIRQADTERPVTFSIFASWKEPK